MRILTNLPYKQLLFRGMCLLLAVVVGLSLFGPRAALAALSQDDINALNNDSVWHVFDKAGANSGSCGLAVVTAANGSVDRFLQVLSFQESGGNPKAENKSGSASGKYQYVDRTWQSTAKTYYPPALQFGGHASNAPEEVQDAVAYLEYTKQSHNLNGDLYKMAVNHYLPAALKNESLQDVVPAGGNSLTPRQYATKLVTNVNKGVGSNIPLKYTQAPDFATWLAKVGGDASAAVGTATTTACQGIPSDKFVFYDQSDPKWSGLAFGTSTVATSGCGPTSVAMVVATLKDQSVTPADTVAFGNSIGAYIPGQGSDQQKMLKQGPEHWGLTSISLGTDLDAAIDVIKSGGLVLAAGTGARPFTTEGHIIVLRGVTSDGKIQVGDPGHPGDNTIDFDKSAILSGLSAAGANGNLWAVTAK